MNWIHQLLEMPLLCGSIFIIVGLVSYLFPPKNINYLYGYRTSSSMKNPEVWAFSQKYATIKMIQAGFILLAVSCTSLFFEIKENQHLILGISSLLLCPIFIFYFTEKAIKTKFPNF
jgi:uncharacterized membrane protein